LRLPDEARTIWLEVCADPGRWPWAEGLHSLIVGCGYHSGDLSEVELVELSVYRGDLVETMPAVQMRGDRPEDAVAVADHQLAGLRRFLGGRPESVDTLGHWLEEASREIQRRVGRPGDWLMAVTVGRLEHWAAEIAQAEMLTATGALPASVAGHGLRRRSFVPTVLLRQLTPATLELAAEGDRLIWDAYEEAHRLIADIAGPDASLGALSTDQRLAFGRALAELMPPRPVVTAAPLTDDRDGEPT
jgi:hypothetical protein